MKNLKLFKSGFYEKLKLLIPIGLLIGSLTSQVWATSGVRLRGDYVGGFSFTSATWTKAIGGDETKRYWDVYHSGGSKYWRIWLDYYNHDGGPDNENEDYDLNVGTSAYMVVNKNKHSFVTTADPGILRIQVDQYGSDKGRSKDEYPYVWVTRPSVEFKYPWDGTNWTLVTATDNHDGTYTYEGTYSGVNRFNAGPNGADKIAPEGSGEGTTVIIGSPTSGQLCQFKWQPGTGDTNTDYRYTGGEEENRGSFTITKICVITYMENGKESGSVPSNTEIVLGNSGTLRTNSGNLAKSGYIFTGWNTRTDGKGTHYSSGGSITPEDNMTLYAEWTRAEWGIKGGDSWDPDKVSDALGDWDTFNPLLKLTDNTHRGTIYLDANTVYYFKITNLTKWNGKDNFAFVGQTHSANLGDNSGGNIRLATGKAGTYTFDYNSSTRALTVTFPNETEHPSTNFVYFSNPDSWITVLGYIYTSSESKLVEWDNSPILSSVTIGGKTYYYMALGSFTKGIFRGEKPSGTWTNKTIDLNSASSNYGKYYSNANPEEWNPFTVRITLNNQSATSFGTEYKDITFNDGTLTTNIICPTKTGYTFGGYYTEENGEGDMIINSSGVWQAPISGYTDASKRWIKDGGNATLYAKWTENEWNVTTAVNPAGTGYASPASATTYSEVTGGSINASNNTGYHFVDWTITEGGGSFVSGATSAENTFKPTANTTLTANFEPNTTTITLNGRGATEAGTSSVTATYDSETLASITNPKKWGYTFGGWVLSSDGTGDPIIDTGGNLVAAKDDYTDGDGKWINDERTLNLYARWTPSLYWVSGSGSEVTGTAFTDLGGGVYRATVTMSEDGTFHLGDGTTAAGPASNQSFATPEGTFAIAPSSYYFTYTGTADQTIVCVYDYSTSELSIGHVVFYLDGAEGDSHAKVSDYEGWHSDIENISGKFEYRMLVEAEDTWSSLCLPFSPTEVKVWSGSAYYDVLPYYRSGGTFYKGHYIIRTPESNTIPLSSFGSEWKDPTSPAFKPSSSTPYIIQWHDNGYFAGKYISFFGNGASLTSDSGDPGLVAADDAHVNLYGNTAMTDLSVINGYLLNDGVWTRGELGENASVGPFECYIRASEAVAKKARRIQSGITVEDTATGWEDVLNSLEKPQIKVYNISGNCVAQYQNCSFDEAARRLSEEYREGVYILHAGNESVKLFVNGK